MRSRAPSSSACTSPAPGYTAGLARGDIVLAVGQSRVDSAADLGRAVAAATARRTGRADGAPPQRRLPQLTAVPGVVT